MENLTDFVDPFYIGNVNILFNRSNKSLYDIFPTKKNYFSKKSNKSYSTYNGNKIENLYIENFFIGENKHLNVTGYIDINNNIYFISKLLNCEFAILVYDIYSTYFSESVVYEEIRSFLKIIQKNSPNIKIGLIICDNYFTEKYNFHKLKDKIYDLMNQEMNCSDQNMIRFLSLPPYYVRDSNEEIQKEIYDLLDTHFADDDKFVYFNDQDAKILDWFLFENEDCMFVFSYSFFEKNYSKFINVDNFLKKLIQCGYLMNFPNTNIKDLYFAMNAKTTSFFYILLKIFNSQSALSYYRTNKKDQRKSKLSANQVIDISSIHQNIPWAVQKVIKNVDRLILRILMELNIGRKFGDEYLYLRKYSYNGLSDSSRLAFIYS